MRIKNWNDLDTVLLNDMEVGQWFVWDDGQAYRLVDVAGEKRVLYPDGRVLQLYGSGYDGIPVEGPHVTREEATEAATPKVLTFGDLKGGDEFRSEDSGPDAVLIKLAPDSSSPRPYNAIWKRDGFLCHITPSRVVERVEDGGVGAE